ncbi:hypothetical protein [Streptomyces sp. NPDC056821]
MPSALLRRVTLLEPLAQQPLIGGSVEFGGVSGELQVAQISAVPLRR